MDDQEDPPVQENPPEAPLAQPIVLPTQTADDVQSVTNATSNESQERVGRAIR